MTARRRRLRRLLLIAAGLLLVLTYAPTHRWEDEYLVFERDASGAMVRDGDTEVAFGLRFDVGHTDSSSRARPAQDNSPDAAPGKVATRRVWFLDVSGDRLLRETALRMQGELKELDWVQETAYFPRTYQPLHDSTLPDIFVTLELLDSSELHLPLYHRFDHTLQVGIGRRPLRSEADPSSFRAAVHAELVLHTGGGYFGLTSASRRFDRAVEALCAEIDLAGRLAQWRERYGAIEGAPEDLIAAERELPELPLAPDPERHQLYQGGYFLVHAEAMWMQPAREEPAAHLDAFARAFEAAGWSPVPGLTGGIAFTRGRLYFEAFERSRTEGHSLTLFLQDRYTPAEARALFERCLAQGDPARTRLFLEHVYPSLRAGLLAELRASPEPVALEDEWVELLAR